MRQGFSFRAALVSVLLFPLLLNGAQLLNILKADPVLSYAALQTGVTTNDVPLHGRFDPSIGTVFQALGRRSADELLHGRLPWWNPDQGIGEPLAGEMSPGSFFPFILMEAFPNGQILLDVTVQMLAGFFTLLLALRIGLGATAGTVAALLFECNGTFAWLGGGWCYPLPFLPLLLYGIELSGGAGARERRFGTIVIALAVAISISAAMIEVAYLDGLLGVAWALLRIVQRRDLAYVLRLAGAAVAGLMLAAPLLIAFADYLSVAHLGTHTGEGSVPFAGVVLSQILLPYVLGPVFFHDSGYAGAALSLCAGCGLFGAFQRPLRLVLGAWIFLALAVTTGSPVVEPLFRLVPGMKYVAYNRYLDGSWEFALALLAGFFVYDLLAGAGRLWVRSAFATTCFFAAFAVGFVQPQPNLMQTLLQPEAAAWHRASLGWAILAVLIVWSTARLGSTAQRVLVVSVALALESVTNYVIPALGLPLTAKLEDGSVAFLRAHLGLQRFYSLGPFSPNYGSYFNLAQLNDLSLPVARNWADYARAHLDNLAAVGGLVGQHWDQVGEHVIDYEAAATKYIVVRPGNPPLLNFAVPVNDAVPPVPYRFADAREPFEIALTSAPNGLLAAVTVVASNYGQANGIVNVRACSQGRCVVGARSPLGTHNNAPFMVTFDRPLAVRNGSIALSIGQTNATVSAALWLYAAVDASGEAVTFAGKRLNGLAARVGLLYATSERPALVYHDRAAEIYELPHPAPYFTAPDCALQAAGRERVEAQCTRPSTLVRRELFMPGWTATVNGASAGVGAFQSVFQSIALPAGSSSVAFSFAPPFMNYGFALFGFGVLALAIQIVRLIRAAPQ